MTETSGTMTETSGTMPGTSTTMPGTSEAMESSSSESSGEPLGEFDTRIQPIFEANCSCHLTTVGSGGLSLREGLAYDNLVGVMSAGAPSLTRVVPGSTQDSYLVHKLRGTHLDFGGVGMQMPLGATLPEADIAEIEAWIDEGAPE
jgi:hypothetical protein